MFKIINIVSSLFKKNILYIVLTFLGIAALFLWRLDPNPGTLGDLGLNAYTEILGIIITVALVEKIIRNQKKEDLLPIKAAAYRDIQLFFSRIVGFWAEVHTESVPESDPTTVEELFSESSFDKMMLRLNIDGVPNVSPPTTWMHHFYSQGTDFRNRGEKILNRYYTFLDTEVFKYIHYLVEDSFFISYMTQLQSIRSSDQQYGTPRPKI